MKYDMHTHSYYSDGKLSPEEIIDLAIFKKLDGLAITDHDEYEGYKKGREYIEKNNLDIELIPGIEFGTNYKDEEVHILGYFMDMDNPKLVKAINQLKQWRIDRGEKILSKLASLNINIDRDQVLKVSKNQFVGRVPIAIVLRDNGYVNDIGEAFEKYLGLDKPCYVEKETYDIATTISLIKEVGGVAVLAHPILLKHEETIEHCIGLGIDGIECDHSKQDASFNNKMLEVCKEYSLIPTGGSDCHGRLQHNNGLLLGKHFANEESIKEMKVISNGRK